MLKNRYLYVSLIIALIILFFSLAPPGDKEPKLFVSDKLLHFIAYCAMVLPVLIQRHYPHFLVFITASAYGGILEFIQPFWEREADIWDFWTNIAGIIFGILIAKSITYITPQI